MIDSTQIDYHVHYYLDACANNEMTFENIEKASFELGLKEIAVLKHYSENLPNGKEDWICWHKIKKNEFEQYLKEKENYISRYGIKILSGVETELVNENGDINIPLEEQKKLDMVALSVHYMIDLQCLKMDLLLYPNLSFCPEHNNDEGRAEVERWRKKANSIDAREIIKGLVNGYVNAIKKNPKIKTLAHMYDGLLPLRTYLIDFSYVTDNELIKIFEPLYAACTENNVLWELCASGAQRECVVREAVRRGVELTATADSHFISGGWANLVDRGNAVNYLKRFL